MREQLTILLRVIPFPSMSLLGAVGILYFVLNERFIELKDDSPNLAREAVYDALATYRNRLK